MDEFPGYLCLTDLLGGNWNIDSGYPAWTYRESSRIRPIAADAFEEVFGVRPEITTIHAGLECGLFLEKYPNLDMISFGPTLRDVHSPNERIKIKTVGLWWAHLLELLKSVPAK